MDTSISREHFPRGRWRVGTADNDSGDRDAAATDAHFVQLGVSGDSAPVQADQYGQLTASRVGLVEGDRVLHSPLEVFRSRCAKITRMIGTGPSRHGTRIG